MRGRPRPYSVSGVFPSQDRLLALLPLLHGVDRRVLVDLPRALHTGVGLDQGAGELAECIRRQTAELVNPRDVVGYWDIAARYRLLHEDHDHRLALTRRGRHLLGTPNGRVQRWIAGREGLTHLLVAIAAGSDTLASLLPAWRDTLSGNPRFAASASPPRSLAQRVATLLRGGWIEAHGAHQQRLSSETGFRRREPEPAFAELTGGLALTAKGHACLTA
ncbi:MAG: hypothetical protein DHS20C15_32050 [Planctomycetota bacterium]|nr:MAG: hypothetical protein DHS20C15_32050 [Planctomycetota bacterium]